MSTSSEVILQFLEQDAFPEPENAAAVLEPDALPELAASIAKIRDEIQTDIRSLSREAAPDIDGWIKQAKQLQADIEESRATAREIVQQAETGKVYRAQEEDAAAKGRLLEDELAFNEALADALEHLQIVYGLLDSAQEASIQNNTLVSLEKLHEATEGLKLLDGFVNTRFAGILRDRAAKLRASVTEDVTRSWNELIHVDAEKHRITLRNATEKAPAADLNTVVQALEKLGVFDRLIHRLAQDFNQLILAPRLIVSKNKTVAKLTIAEDTIETSQHASDLSTVGLIKDICEVFDFLGSRLPLSVSSRLSAILIPLLLPQLQTRWLEPSIPGSLEGLEDLEDVIESVNDLAADLHKKKWSGSDELLAWADDIPRLWLSKRKEASLAAVRQSCFRSTGQKKTAERVETQIISDSDVLATGQSGGPVETKPQQEDDWDAGWEEESEDVSAKPEVQTTNTNIQEEEEDDDAAEAWGGFDEDEPVETKPEESSNNDVEPSGENEEDEWGAWGDDDAQPTEESSKTPKKATQPAVSTPMVNGKQAKQEQPVPREITLREAYTITSLPDSLLELIEEILSDVEALGGPHFADSKVKPAANGLYSVPTLILAMFRATASTYYAKDVAGNMLIYNDCTHLTDKLRSLAEKNRSSRLKLESDINALESLRKRSYGKEMESQRTIIRDLLDGAQGFTNCSVSPFAAECENAVTMTVDRIRDVERQWNGVLSRSALLQSIGQLLSTAISKICIDIQDMSDISESDSHRLRKFCNQVAELKDLFQEDERDMTGVYTPQWFKFQYLSEILESSLADIKFLWIEGELRLEFEVEEVIDLIEALFAESEHRRRAITEIKRSVGL